MSLNAAAIAVMVERGLSAADILAVAEALEVKKDRTGADRQARYRERHKVTRDVTRDEVTEPLSPLAPPDKSFPNPSKTTPPIPPKPTTDLRGSRLTDAWEPKPLTGKALAMVERWQSGEVEREIAKFRNYWMGRAGKDACKTDWQRTFINWLISADERKPRNAYSAAQPNPNPRSRLLDALHANEAELRSASNEDHAGTWAALPPAGTG